MHSLTRGGGRVKSFFRCQFIFLYDFISLCYISIVYTKDNLVSYYVTASFALFLRSSSLILSTLTTICFKFALATVLLGDVFSLVVLKLFILASCLDFVSVFGEKSAYI